MAEDILAELRAKEDEMEAFINDARRQAASIREAAHKSARELRARGSAELDERLKAVSEEKTAAIMEEAGRIEEEGLREAGRLRERGERNFEKVVQELMRFIIEPGGASK